MEQIRSAAEAVGISEKDIQGMFDQLRGTTVEYEGAWPPRLANRATRRKCQHRGKGDPSYCVDCGTCLSPERGE